MPDFLVGNIWPFVINGPSWTTQVLLVVYGTHIPFSLRIIPGFAALAICMAVLPALCQVGGSTGFYTASLVNVVLGTASGAT